MQISLITAAIDAAVALLLLILAGKAAFFGMIYGGAVSIGFHWWLYRDLSRAIERDELSAVRYANLHAVIRNVALAALILLSAFNPLYELSVPAVIAGVLSIKPVIYVYGILMAGNNRTRNHNEHSD